MLIVKLFVSIKIYKKKFYFLNITFDTKLPFLRRQVGENIKLSPQQFLRKILGNFCERFEKCRENITIINITISIVFNY